MLFKNEAERKPRSMKEYIGVCLLIVGGMSLYFIYNLGSIINQLYIIAIAYYLMKYLYVKFYKK